jgi:galactose mutarotase-like enzyme
MKKLFPIIVAIAVLSSCDPVAEMEANIFNLTNEDLIIEFGSSKESRRKNLEIPKGEMRLFEEVYDVGNDFLEPALYYYDSVVVKNNAEQILKIYKPNDTGKNIYNIDDYWFLNEPSKRFFKYVYEINNEDIE